VFNRLRGITAATDNELYEAFDMEYEYDIRETFDKYIAGEQPLSAWMDMLGFQEAIYPENYVKLRYMENHDMPRIAGLVPDEKARRNFTALLYFLKGTVLLYGGQEYSCDHVPSLFDKDVFPRTGKDITPLLQKLNAVRREHLSAEDWFTAEADDANDIAVCLRDDGKTKKLGVFSLKGKSAEVEVPVKDGNYVNYITGETVTVKLGVVGGIYDDLWASAKAALADEGIDLEIVQFSDYVTPNNALANGDIDLNAFQHRIYLQNEIDNYGYAIQNIGNTFIIPLNLYSQKVSSVDELKDGDVVAIPDDLTNGGRALKVLEAAGLIELDPNAAFNPTVDDITSYKVNITIEELKANTIPSILPDVAAAVVNGNYALDFGLKTDEAIYKDSVLDVEEYWNLIAARTADIEDPDTAAIYEKVVEAFQSSATEDVFNNTFGGYFIAVGWDQDLINQ
jgi:D-methionine transport system substrate-binding protein